MYKFHERSERFDTEVSLMYQTQRCSSSVKGFERDLKCKDNVDFCDGKTYLGAVILYCNLLEHSGMCGIQTFGYAFMDCN